MAENLTANRFYTPPGSTAQTSARPKAPADPMKQLSTLAKMLDEYLNGVGVKANARRNGFILMAYKMGGKPSYMSNTDRRQALELMKAQVAKFEAVIAEEERISSAIQAEVDGTESEDHEH